MLSGKVHAFFVIPPGGFSLCTKYFRSCILWPYKILLGPAITYKLLRLTHRPMHVHFESLLQLVSVPGDGADGSALSCFSLCSALQLLSSFTMLLRY